MPTDVREVEVCFAAYRKGTIEIAREIEVKANERFVEMINAHEKIRPFLREYPFPVSRANVSIVFRKPNNEEYTDGSVIHAFYAKGNLCFYARDSTGKSFLIAEEPYAESLKIVKTEKSTQQ